MITFIQLILTRIKMNSLITTIAIIMFENIMIQ